MRSLPRRLRAFDSAPFTALLAVARFAQGSSAGAGPGDVYQAFFELSPSGLLLLDGTRRVMRANPAATRLFAAPGTDLVGRPFAELLAPDSRAALERAFDLVPERGSDVPVLPTKGRDATGVPFPVEVVLLRLRPWAEEGYGVILRDLRERVATGGRPGARTPGGPSRPYTLGELLMADRLRELV